MIDALCLFFFFFLFFSFLFFVSLFLFNHYFYDLLIQDRSLNVGAYFPGHLDPLFGA